MKILFLAAVYEYGGVSSVIKNILDNLDREKFDITLLVESLSLKHYPLRNDIRLINMDIKPAKGGVRKLVNIFRHLYRIRKNIIQGKPDVVLSVSSSTNSLCLSAFLWPIKNMPKIVLSEHTEQLFVKQKARSFRENILKFLYRVIMFLLYHRADAVICVSNSLAGYVRGFLLMDKRKIKVIHVPVNIEKIRMGSRREIQKSHEDINTAPWVGTLSRLSAEKGINYLIEAFSILLERIDARLIIVGDGEERARLEEMARDLGIENRVSFVGWLENPYNYLRKMDVFVLSSLWEGFPNVIIESMICGVPVIATRSVGGVEEVVKDGVDGLLVPPKDIRALSDSIYRLLQDKVLKTRFTEEANKKIEQFDSYKITKQYEYLMLGLFR